MKIYLARHGQSRWQVTQTDGDWNSPLTALGQQQAERLGAWLANHEALDNGSRLEIGQVWASPLLRAQETAVHVSNALHLTPITDDYLRETEFYIAPHLPTAVSPYQAHTPYTPSTEYTAFKEQAQQALHNLVAAAESGNAPILAISHGGLISTLLRLATGSDAISFWIYNTSLNLIEWKRGRWHLVHLNLWDHLPPPLRTF